MQLDGPVPIGPTPTASATSPEGSDEDSLLEIPASPAVTSGTLVVAADAVDESTIDATLQSTMQDESPNLPESWNARGYAIVEDLSAISDNVEADVLESESVAACDGDQVVFGSAARLDNVTLAGSSISALNPTPNEVVVDDLLGITVVMWETDWDPATNGTTDGSDTVFTNALHVTAPLGVDLVVSHSEATAT